MKKYKILKGWHYCLNFFPKFYLKKIGFPINECHTITFTEESKYEVDEPSAVNKLFGICYGLLGVHKNSDRLGWTYDKDKDLFNIYLYSYVDGYLFKEIVDTVKSNEKKQYQLWSMIFRNGRLIEVNDKTNNWHLKTVRYKSDSNYKIIPTLGPYFGGNTPAPKTITITKN